MADNIKSILKMDRLVFDKIEFKRLGFKTDAELQSQIQCNIAKRNDEEIYRVTLIFRGQKTDEYTLEVSLTGFFSFDVMPDDEKLKDTLISKNTVAIMMPYLRSQISLITAQPGVDCVVLPPFNINSMMEK